jgi:hypothetical protein
MMGLSRGNIAAARFATDLANTRRLASAEPPVRVTPANSHATAEVAINAAIIELRNWGCGSSGGQIGTSAEPVVWKTATDGTVGSSGVFHASYEAGSGWTVELNAC